MGYKKEVIIPALIIAIFFAVLLGSLKLWVLHESGRLNTVFDPISLNFRSHSDSEENISNSTNIAESATNQNKYEQRIAELESQVESLNKKIREQNRTPSTETRSSEVTESSSESTSNKTGNDIRLPTIKDIDCEQFTEAEIVSVDYRKDQNFNGYLIVEVKNNYRRTIRSLRISTSGWIERYNGYYNEKVRAGTETEPVTIRPGAAEKIILNDNWGPVLKPMIVVDAVSFTDGAYDESSPGFDNSNPICDE